jgi:hypothetical protein
MLELLDRAQRLGRDEWLSVADVPGPPSLVLDAMVELLRGGFAVGTLKRAGEPVQFEDAQLFGLTATGKRLCCAMQDAREVDAALESKTSPG